MAQPRQIPIPQAMRRSMDSWQGTPCAAARSATDSSSPSGPQENTASAPCASRASSAAGRAERFSQQETSSLSRKGSASSNAASRRGENSRRTRFPSSSRRRARKPMGARPIPPATRRQSLVSVSQEKPLPRGPNTSISIPGVQPVIYSVPRPTVRTRREKVSVPSASKRLIGRRRKGSQPPVSFNSTNWPGRAAERLRGR